MVITDKQLKELHNIAHILEYNNKIGETIEEPYASLILRLNSIVDDCKNSVDVETLAKEKASDEIRSFCEYVMHPDSDLHKDAEDWINTRLK